MATDDLRSTPLELPPLTETLLSEMVDVWFRGDLKEPMPKRDDEPRFFERMERVYKLLADRAPRSETTDRMRLLEDSLTLAVDTLTIYASSNPHGPRVAQDALQRLALMAKGKADEYPFR